MSTTEPVSTTTTNSVEPVSAPENTTNSVPTSNNSNNTVSTIKSTQPKIPAEFVQAIEDSFAIISQSYDLADNKEVFDFIKATLLERFAHVKPREIKVGGVAGEKAGRTKAAYNIYISQQFAKNKSNPSGLATTQLMTKYSQEWKNLTDAEKQPYIDITNKLNQDAVASGKVKAPSAPRAMSGYNLYVKKNSAEFTKNNPKMTAKERMSKIGAQWKALDAQTRDGYTAEAKSLFNANVNAKSSVPVA